MAKSDKVERRKRRQRGAPSHGGWQVESIHYSDRTFGPGVEAASPAEVFAALEQVPAELDWPAVAARVVPLFERMRPYPPQMPERAKAIVAPGVTIGFGIDFGPGFVAITPQMVERWSMSVADLAAHALAQVHALAAQLTPEQVHHAPVGAIEVRAIQTDLGIGSALVLAPSELARLFGAQPRLFIAPMRDLLVGLPTDAFDGRAVTVLPLGPRLQHLLAG